jgi:two-component system chemotaxis response regulator CheY
MRTCLVVDDSSVDHISRALHAGANEYIMKPFDEEIVAAKFQEVGLSQIAEPMSV